MKTTVSALLLLVVAVSAPRAWSDTAAIINGVPVSNEEYVAALETTAVPGPDGIQSAGAIALEKLVSNIVLAQLAEKEGVAVTDAQVEKRFIVAQKEGSVAQALSVRRMNTDEIKTELRARQALVNLAMKDVKVTDGEVEDNYYKNRDQYKRPARVKIAVVISKDKNKVIKAAARVKKGEDFGKVAAALSDDDVSKSNGGVLGWVWLGQPGVPTSVCSTALGLKVGGVSAPVKIEEKWVMMKAVERSAPVFTPLSEVKEDMRESIGVERGLKDRELQKKLQDAARDATIEIRVERFKDLAAELKSRIAPAK